MFRFQATLQRSLLAALLSLLLATSALPARANPVSIDIAFAPPPPQTELAYGFRPGYTWTPGYWQWLGNGFRWVNGYWLEEVPGQRWIAPRWEFRGSHYHFEPGYWQAQYVAPMIWSSPAPSHPQYYQPRSAWSHRHHHAHSPHERHHGHPQR
jgi:hypothetical protein